MPLTEKQIALASTIDHHVTQIVGAGGGDEELLLSMSDYLERFKQVMDASTQSEMDSLCERFPGVYRFTKLLELIAQGIADGSVEVPK